MLSRVLLLISVILVTVNGFSFSSFQNNKIFSSPLSLKRTILKPAATVSLILASQLFGNVDISRADLESLSSPDPPVTRAIQIVSTSDSTSTSTTSSDEDRVRRKLEKQARASGSEGKVDDSYLGSLSREKTKQERLKKGKSERGKDLCEMLGRGC